jgi:hypothetical protein
MTPRFYELVDEVRGCGCTCICHADELTDPRNWPGPCAACCEPGMDCDCGFVLAYMQHAEARERKRAIDRRPLDNRRSVFLAERLSREPARRRSVRRKRGA